MAISECDDHIEVRIKRPPADSLATYFEEYVDLKASGCPDDKICESYIIAGDDDEQYLIEVILKPGFKRYGATSLHVNIWLGPMPSQTITWCLPPIGKGGLKDEAIFHILRWTVKEKGIEMSKNIAFCRLEPGSEGDTQTLGMDPTTLGTIRLELQRSTSTQKEADLTVPLVSKHYRGHAGKKPSSQNACQCPDESTKAPEIDEDLAKLENGGITHSTKFLDEGARPRRTHPPWSRHVNPPHDRIGVVKFVFKYRTQGVLEALGIVKKPPPLWQWAWDDLNILDRPKAFKQLQKDNKMYEMKEWEMKIRIGVENQEPPEWKAYSKIRKRDKKRLFEVLQEKNKAYTRRDGRRDVKLSVKQLEYEQGPEGWEKHGDTHIISAKEQEHPADVGEGFGDPGPSASPKGPEQIQIPTANHTASAKPFSAAPGEVVTQQKLSNIGQDINMQERITFRERSQQVKDELHVKAEVVDATSMHDIPPQGANTNFQAGIDVAREQASPSHNANVQKTKRRREKSEFIVDNELVIKPEFSTSTTVSPIENQSPLSKRRKISNTLTHTAKPGHHSKLFSTTIDITGVVPIVEPKAAITIDLAESSPLSVSEKRDNSTTFIPTKRLQPKTLPSTWNHVTGWSTPELVDNSRTIIPTRQLQPKTPRLAWNHVTGWSTPESVNERHWVRLSEPTSVEPKFARSAGKRGIALDLSEAELMSSSDAMVDVAAQPHTSSARRVRPTPTQAAERGECSLQ